jgi:hypothetical protein
MKNKIFISLVVLFSLGVFTISAQNGDVVVFAKKLETKKIPTALRSEIQKDFPTYTLDGVELLPSKLYEQRWVMQQSNPFPADMQYYEVDLKGKDFHSSAVYTAKGQLLHSREVLNNAKLPLEVAQSIASYYPGWVEWREKEIIKNGKKEVTDYVVFLKKGMKEERVVLNPQGKILHHFEI